MIGYAQADHRLKNNIDKNMITTTPQGKFLTSPVTWEDLANGLPDSWQPSLAAVSPAYKARACSHAEGFMEELEHGIPYHLVGDSVLQELVWARSFKTPMSSEQLTAAIEKTMDDHGWE